MNRTAHRWDVTLQRDDGEIAQYPIRTFWDPEQEGTAEAVGNAAQAEAWYRSNKAHKFHPISASLVDDAEREAA